MGKGIDLSGQTYGRWKVLGLSGTSAHKKLNWNCVCECGTTREVCGQSLRNGVTLSCGCLRKEMMTGSEARYFSHRMHGTSTYRTWRGMKTRCLNSVDTSYGNYGARGIKVCTRWMVFENFLADMGVKPPGLSLERIDNDGNYEPGNCKWATQKEQANNKRTTIRIGGRSLAEVAEALEIPYPHLHKAKQRNPDLFVDIYD